MPASLSRWRPFAEMEELRSRTDRMFEELMGEAREIRAEADWAPAVDVHRYTSVPSVSSVAGPFIMRRDSATRTSAFQKLPYTASRLIACGRMTT